MATVDIVHRDVHAAHHDAHAHPTGWRRYLYSTNHKDIGTMYLTFAIVAGLIGGVLSIGMRSRSTGTGPSASTYSPGITGRAGGR